MIGARPRPLRQEALGILNMRKSDKCKAFTNRDVAPGCLYVCRKFEILYFQGFRGCSGLLKFEPSFRRRFMCAGVDEQKCRW